MVVLPRGAKAKDPRAAPGSVLPTESNDLKVFLVTTFKIKIFMKYFKYHNK